jgi:hypothetical protein
MRALSYSPQPSLNGTHCTIDVMPLSCSIIRRSSDSKLAWPAADVSFTSASDGMSCHTISPSRSAQ